MPFWGFLRRDTLRSIVAFAVLLQVAGVAHAELLQYEFQTARGEARTLAPQANYANAVGDMTFYLNTGIDRKVRLSITDQNGKEVSQIESHTIGGSDRIVVDGKTYYGASLKLAAPSEGQYTVTESIMRSSGEAVKTATYPLTIDNTPPKPGAWDATSSTYAAPYGWDISGDRWLIGYDASTTVKRIGMDDASGIASATATSFYSQGEHQDEQVAKVSLGIKGNEVDAGNMRALFPAGKDDQYQLVLDVTDKAGNTRTIKQNLRFDDYAGLPADPVAIKQDGTTDNYLGLTGFVPFKRGMSVEQNPVTVVWEIPKSNWHQNDAGGLLFTSENIVKQDASNVYVQTTCVIGNSDSCGQIRDRFHWNWSYVEPRINVKLGAGAATVPAVKKYEFHYSDIGWGPFSRRVPSASLPVTIDAVRVTTGPNAGTQVAKSVATGDTCEIAPGDTSCVIPWQYTMNKGTVGYIHGCCVRQGLIPDYTGDFPKDTYGRLYVYLKDAPTITSANSYPVVSWNDLYVPTVTAVRYPDPDTIEASIAFLENGGLQNSINLGPIELHIGDKVVSGKKLSSVNNNTVLVYQFSLKGVADGQYQPFILTANNTGTTRQYPLDPMTIDTQPPSIAFNIGDKSEIESLDDISVSVSDAVDENAKITAIRLTGGPTHDDVQLAWRADTEDTGVFRLEYPVMFPSLEQGESYTLSVTAKDSHDNEGTKTLTFSYKPRVVTITNPDYQDGAIRIPASVHAFTRHDGNTAIESEPLTLSDGSAVSGAYAVTVTLRSDSQIPLRINGTVVQPGETQQVMSHHDFSASHGRLSLPVATVNDGDIGSATLLINTVAPNAPTLIATVKTWQPSATLSSDHWDLRQVVDEMKVVAGKGDGSLCSITADEALSKASDVYEAPVCLLEWDAYPVNIEATTDQTKEKADKAIPILQGYTPSVGEQQIAYSLYLFDTSGEKVKVGGGTRNITIGDAFGAIAIEPRDDVHEINQHVEDVRVTMQQSDGPDCTLTANADRAIAAASRLSSGAHRMTCLVEWTHLPSGLAQKDSSVLPELDGHLDQIGATSIEWRLSTFSSEGEKIVLNEQIYPVTVVVPDAPKISIDREQRLDDGTLLMPVEGGNLGMAKIEGVPSTINFTVRQGDQILDEGSSRAISHGENAGYFYRRIMAAAAPLDTITEYSIEASYQDMPEKTATLNFKVASIPNSYIKPMVEIDADKALDTEDLPVIVSIRDRRKLSDPYDKASMGTWVVRLVKDMGRGVTEVATPYTPIDANGDAHFNMDLSGITQNSIRIVAEAKLQTSIPSYERVETSVRPALVTVLHGGEISGEIETQRISGQAPFRAVFKLRLADIKDQRATGAVMWQISDDNGATWKDYDPGRLMFQLVNTFDEGVYLVRAETTNQYSGKKAVVPPVEVIAYNRPDVKISGPDALFLGATGTYQASVTVDDKPVDGSGVVIEWSEDGGKTYQYTGDQITLTRSERESVRLFARVRSSASPVDDRYAYGTDRKVVSFRQVKPPFVYLAGPGRMEAGKAYDFSARVRMPYQGMSDAISGHFILPDGSTQDGTELSYTPTVAEVESANGLITIGYEAMIDGYPESKVTKDKRVRVWEYVWPNFALSLQNRIAVAPVDVTARVRAIGYSGSLEEPQYEWHLPDNAVVLNDRQDAVRSFTITEPGTYTVEATVSDARGNRTPLSQQITVTKAAPWVVDVDYRASNRANRAPLDVIIRPKITGGHPYDRVVSRTYKVDGEALDGQESTFARTTLDAGEHTLGVDISTKMGVTASGQTDVTVSENQPPVCTLEKTESRYSWTIRASCTDVDGRVAKYLWTLNGEPVNFSSYRITLSKGTYPQLPPITLVATDDGGADSAPVNLL